MSFLLSVCNFSRVRYKFRFYTRSEHFTILHICTFFSHVAHSFLTYFLSTENLGCFVFINYFLPGSPKGLFPGLEIKFFPQEQFCSKVQNFRSKFSLTRSKKCIYYQNGPKVEGATLLLSYFFGANVLEPVTNCTFVTVNFEPCSFICLWKDGIFFP